MAHLARPCDNCSAFTYTRQLNGNALPGSGSQGARGVMKPFCWCPRCSSPLLSLFSTPLSHLLPNPQLFNPFWHFQWDTIKINLFSRMVVISNYFPVCNYLLLLQKYFQNLFMSCVFVVLHNTNSRSPFSQDLATQTPASFILKSQLQKHKAIWGVSLHISALKPGSCWAGNSSVLGRGHLEPASPRGCLVWGLKASEGFPCTKSHRAGGGHAAAPQCLTTWSLWLGMMEEVARARFPDGW